MKLKKFNTLAQNDPLAVTEEMTNAAQQSAEKSNRTIVLLIKVVLGMLVVPGSLIACAAIAAMASVLLNNDLAIEWSLPMLTKSIDTMVPIMLLAGVALMGMIWPITRLLNNNDTTMNLVPPLSQSQGDQCAQVVAWCMQSDAAKTFRDAVLAKGQELRTMHFLHMKKMVDAENAPREDEERALACRAAHGLDG